MNDQLSRKKRLRKWKKWSIYPTIIPFFLLIFFDKSLGYTFGQAIHRHLSDLSLVVFAIAVNVLGAAIDLDSKRFPNTRDSFIFSSFLLCILGIGFFGFFYMRNPSPSLFMRILTPFVLIILVIITITKGIKCKDQEHNPQNPTDDIAFSGSTKQNP